MSDRFDELVGQVGDREERERLRRVHELLLSVDPPPDLVAAPTRLQRRRPGRLALLAAALVAIAFGAGFFLGDTREADAVRVIPMEGVGGASGTSATIELLPEDDAGNWPMNFIVRGLEPSRDRTDWYELWLTRDGRLVSSCGRFIVDGDRTEVTLSVPYALRSYDGWVVTRHGSSTPLLTT